MIRVLVVVAVCASGVCLSACSGASDPARPPRHHSGETQLVDNAEVLLVPTLLGGTAGWCEAVVGKELGGCARVLATPIVSEGCGPHEYSPHTIEAYVLTTSRVAAVSIEGGTRIPTRAESALPDGLRAAFVEIHSKSVLGRRRHCPRFTALDARGHVIQRSPMIGAPLAIALPSRLSWRRPMRPPSGACTISTTHLPGASPRWGSVATRIRSYPELIGRPLLTCIDVEYDVVVPEGGETDLTAAVLLDARQPGARPALLPSMTPLLGHEGIFKAPCSGGELVARRIPGAWLVVEENGEEGTSDIEQSLRLLEHLHATIRL
jgi:hypothetical protein